MFSQNHYPRKSIIHRSSMVSLDLVPEVERLPRDELGKEQHRSLLVQLANMRERSPFYHELLEAEYHPRQDGPKFAEELPLTTRMDLVSAQRDIPPCGGLLAVPTDDCSILGFTNAIASGMTGYPELLLARYKLKELPKDAVNLIEEIGRRRGALRAGGRVDFQKASEALINEFRNGALGRISLETPSLIEANKAISN